VSTATSTTSHGALPDGLGDAARAFLASQHGLLIGAERPAAADGRTLATLDPATGRTIAEVAHAGVADVDRAVAAAREALEHGPWATLAAAERGRLIWALADAVDAHAEELAQVESLDQGKPVGLARHVDVAMTVAHLRYFAGWPTKIEGNVVPVADTGTLCYTRREPVGVCAAISNGKFHGIMAAHTPTGSRRV
jgi:acyl-CoA reductase-like NAD-dependent aldehyde dehydrogenase